jgi:MoxR-like ATPase
MADNWLTDRRSVRRVVPNGYAEDRWPAHVPAVAQLLDEGLELAEGVTLLVGENGTGKSTLVEAVAMAFGLSRGRVDPGSALDPGVGIALVALDPARAGRRRLAVGILPAR